MDRDRQREADIRAARKLDVSVAEIQQASATLWGHSLFSERENRIPETAKESAAKRAQVTRKLYAELNKALTRDEPQEPSSPLS
jgi:predicted ATPase